MQRISRALLQCFWITVGIGVVIMTLGNELPDGAQTPLRSSDNGHSNPSLLSLIAEKYRPDLGVYQDFYRHVHQDPEISGLEAETAKLVAHHLRQLEFDEVHTGIGGHGVVGVLRNGPGKVILTRAELDALPIEEQTDVPYRSTKRMVDRYGNERPIMHACGHDMHMAALLGAAALLKAAYKEWSGTLLVLFQPDEEETGGARAMVDDGLYSKVPVPDIMLGQHVVPLESGQVAIRPGTVLVAADSVNIRVTGGPCPGINPQMCVDPIPVAMRIVSSLPGWVRDEVGEEKDATVACWGFHAGVPGNDYVAHADVLLDIKTVDPEVRRRVLDLVERKTQEECRRANTPRDPEIRFSVRAPLTSNDLSVSSRVREAFAAHFQSRLMEMRATRACEDFSILGAAHDVPYAYWNFGGNKRHTDGEGGGDEEVPTNHSPFFAPEIGPTLKAGTDAMALAVLAFLARTE